MKKVLFFSSLAFFLFACTNNDDKTKSASTTDTTSTKPMVDLPYTASYSSNWSTDVSDADLKTVLMTYKDWSDNNMSGLGKVMGDTVVVDMSSGDHLTKSNSDLMKMWSISRDSMSSVKIDMKGWHKMYATDKKEGYVVTWYDETDTYKTGKVDSASYHDINQLKDGKIIWYAQYKRPKKKQM
jgi:ketosteroid isomerase-like protein